MPNVILYTQKKEELKAQPSHAPSCNRKIAGFHGAVAGFIEEDDEGGRDYYTVMAERCPPRE